MTEIYLFTLGFIIFINLILRPLRKVYILYGPIGSAYKTKQIKKLYETKSEFTRIEVVDSYIGSNIVYTAPGVIQGRKDFTVSGNNISADSGNEDNAFMPFDHMDILKEVWNYDIDVVRTLATITCIGIIDAILIATHHKSLAIICQTITIIYIMTKLNRIFNFPHIVVINGQNLNPEQLVPYYLAYSGLGYHFEVVDKIFKTKYTNEIKEMLWSGNSKYILDALKTSTDKYVHFGDFYTPIANNVLYQLIEGPMDTMIAELGKSVNLTKCFREIYVILANNYSVSNNTVIGSDDISKHFITENGPVHPAIKEFIMKLGDTHKHSLIKLYESKAEERYSEEKFVKTLLSKKETIVLGNAFKKWFELNDSKHYQSEYILEAMEIYHSNIVVDYEEVLEKLSIEKGIELFSKTFGTKKLDIGHVYNIHEHINKLKTKYEDNDIIEYEIISDSEEYSSESSSSDSDEQEQKQEQEQEQKQKQKQDPTNYENKNGVFWVVCTVKPDESGKEIIRGVAGVRYTESEAESVKAATCLVPGYSLKIIKQELLGDIPTTLTGAQTFFENHLIPEKQNLALF